MAFKRFPELRTILVDTDAVAGTAGKSRFCAFGGVSERAGVQAELLVQPNVCFFKNPGYVVDTDMNAGQAAKDSQQCIEIIRHAFPSFFFQI